MRLDRDFAKGDAVVDLSLLLLARDWSLRLFRRGVAFAGFGSGAEVLARRLDLAGLGLGLFFSASSPEEDSSSSSSSSSPEEDSSFSSSSSSPEEDLSSSSSSSSSFFLPLLALGVDFGVDFGVGFGVDLDFGFGFDSGSSFSSLSSSSGGIVLPGGRPRSRALILLPVRAGESTLGDNTSDCLLLVNADAGVDTAAAVAAAAATAAAAAVARLTGVEVVKEMVFEGRVLFR